MIEALLKDTGFQSFAGIITALVILIIGIIGLKILVALLRRILKKSPIDGALHKFIINSVRIGIWIFIIVAVLSELGVNTTTFVAVLSAAGAAIALALKDSLSNVAGGIIILITKPFCRGDYVMIDTAEGNIKEIDIMTTTLNTIDDKVVIIPNGTVTSSIITNYSREGFRRVDCVFEVGYECDLAKVKDILKDIEKGCSTALHDRPPVIGVSSHGESGVAVDFKVWTTTDKYWDTFYYLHEEVKNVFDREGIMIPYPHMEVTLHKDEK